MAKYNQVSYGSQGSDVTALQELLNQNGYDLEVDGIFGSATQSAVQDYQQQNNLAVDGIVGTNTWASLTSGSTNSSTDTSGTTTPEAESPTGFEYEAYQPSDTVTEAEAMVDQNLAQQPGEYQSQWNDQLNDVIQQILNREDFSYDLNGDVLYQQYKDQYTTQGKLAMMDTMGQASAMTGGYGNSYAQTAGQHAYQGYLQQLNEVIPELYQLALNKYQMEGDELYNQFAVMSDQEDRDYGRWQDDYSRWQSDRDYYTNQYNTERDYDYSVWADGRDFAYDQYTGDRDYNEQHQNTNYDRLVNLITTTGYQPTDAELEAAGMSKEQAAAYKEYWEENNPSSSRSSSSGGSGRSGSYGYDTHGYSSSEIKSMQRAAGITADGVWGPQTQAAYEAGYRPGSITHGALAGNNNESSYTGTTGNNNNTGTSKGFTGSTYSEATAWLRANGYSAAGLMTQSEWQRHKNNNNSHGGEHEASSYQEYLAAYCYGVSH